MGPLRELGPAVATVPAAAVRPIGLADFQAALAAIKPSTDRAALQRYVEWTRRFGVAT